MTRMIWIATLTLVVVVPLDAPAEEAASSGLCEEEAAAGFVSLFDGRTLNGWQGATAGHVAKDGVLICKRDGGGRIFTTKEYSDFILRFEFKLEPGGNNGVGIRTPLEGDAAYVGMEIQILDDTAPEYQNLKPYQFHGSIYGLVPAKRGHLKPVGNWNCEEIVADGGHIKVTLNGQVIVDADVDQIDKPLDGRDHPGMHNKKGHIGFMGHGAHVEFRNIRIKEL